MANHQAVLSTFQFKRSAESIQVYNENSYLMAEYSSRTGTVKWQRVLIATQREVIEKWLRERYPAPGMAGKAQETAAPQAPAPTQAAASRKDSEAHRRRHAASKTPARRRT